MGRDLAMEGGEDDCRSPLSAEDGSRSPLTSREGGRLPRAAEAARSAAAVAASRSLQRLALAALVSSAIALALLAMAASRPSAHSRPPPPRSADALSAVGLAEAEPGSFASKMSALVTAQQAGTNTEKGWYDVLRPAILREGDSLDSKKVAVLQHGEHVLVSEVRGRRARIEAPKEGWVSIKTATGSPIIQRAALGPERGGTGATGLPGAGGLELPQLPQGKGSQDWKGMSASELQQAIQNGKVDPNVVMAGGFEKLSGFLSKANAGLASIVRQKPGATGDEGAGVASPIPLMAPGMKDGKDTTAPSTLPTMEEVQQRLAGRAPLAGQGAAPKDPRNAGLLGQEALQVANKLLQNEGQSLEDTTKGLDSSTKKLMEENIKAMQDSIDHARATKAEKA